MTYCKSNIGSALIFSNFVLNWARANLNNPQKYLQYFVCLECVLCRTCVLTMCVNACVYLYSSVCETCLCFVLPSCLYMCHLMLILCSTKYITSEHAAQWEFNNL